MKFIHSVSTDPAFNLAWEEYILKNIAKKDDIILLWQNQPSIIVGRNQNVYEEVNLEFAYKNKLPIVRRISGGGTVYQDLGNINYTFMTQSKGNVNNYEKMTKPIVEIIKSLGIPIEFVPKSDLKIADMKVSGNAQFVYKDLVLHHGTLLFESDLDTLIKSIKTLSPTYQSISVKSNRSQVTNLKNYTTLSLEHFINYLTSELTKDVEMIHLSKKDLNKIEILKQERYHEYRWNYGESPYTSVQLNDDIYDIKLAIRYGMVEEALVVRNGAIDILLSSSIIGLRCHPEDLSFLKLKHKPLYHLIFDLKNKDEA